MKLAPYINSFTDELEKIAGAGLYGAAIGGGLASKLPGDKLRNGIAGAAVGGIIGKTVGAAHHLLRSEEERHNALAQQQPTGDPSYVPTWQQGYR